MKQATLIYAMVSMAVCLMGTGAIAERRSDLKISLCRMVLCDLPYIVW